ncbi:hypothetical protein PC115_g14673 [Phytophthora cactorum]|uniref:Uncharacterized protein n=1 Tax=Phytophthora cactorum TaxID=29920 RepID=A0A8T1BMZ7_9STRA|nr:hypothetical protein PC115_g14673 [Phytophthora cactorum]
MTGVDVNDPNFDVFEFLGWGQRAYHAGHGIAGPSGVDQGVLVLTRLQLGVDAKRWCSRGAVTLFAAPR